MTTISCKTCGQKYELETEDEELIKQWEESEDQFFCENCATYSQIQVLYSKKKLYDKITAKTPENKIIAYIWKHIIDIPMIIFFFNFSFSKYTHPAGRIVNKWGTLSLLAVIYCILAIIFIRPDLIVSGNSKYKDYFKRCEELEKQLITAKSEVEKIVVPKEPIPPKEPVHVNDSYFSFSRQQELNNLNHQITLLGLKGKTSRMLQETYNTLFQAKPTPSDAKYKFAKKPFNQTKYDKTVEQLKFLRKKRTQVGNDINTMNSNAERSKAGWKHMNGWVNPHSRQLAISKSQYADLSREIEQLENIIPIMESYKRYNDEQWNIKNTKYKEDLKTWNYEIEQLKKRTDVLIKYEGLVDQKNNEYRSWTEHQKRIQNHMQESIAQYQAAYENYKKLYNHYLKVRASRLEAIDNVKKLEREVRDLSEARHRHNIAAVIAVEAKERPYKVVMVFCILSLFICRILAAIIDKILENRTIS